MAHMRGWNNRHYYDDVAFLKEHLRHKNSALKVNVNFGTVRVNPLVNGGKYHSNDQTRVKVSFN